VAAAAGGRTGTVGEATGIAGFADGEGLTAGQPLPAGTISSSETTLFVCLEGANGAGSVIGAAGGADSRAINAATEPHRKSAIVKQARNPDQPGFRHLESDTRVSRIDGSI
jgi:hypothetical protein